MAPQNWCPHAILIGDLYFKYALFHFTHFPIAEKKTTGKIRKESCNKLIVACCKYKFANANINLQMQI